MGSRLHPPTITLALRAILATCFTLEVVTAANAQFFERPIVIKNARIVTMAGPEIEQGTLVIKGGRIENIGPRVKSPFLAQTIDATGKVLTPGFIDSWSALGHLGGSAKDDPTASAWDAFDRYARADFRQALRHGVSAIFIGPGGGPGVKGTGVIIRLTPEGGGLAGSKLKGEAALCVNFGSDQAGVDRLRTFGGVRKAFKKALDYRRALEDYQDDLEEYLEKLKERREKEETKEGKQEEKVDEEKAEDEPPPTPKPEEKAGDDQSYANGPLFIRRAGTDDTPDDESALRPGKKRRRQRGSSGNEKKNEAKKGEKKESDEKEDELKKPVRPTPDRKSEALLKAIDHELPVRIEAHRSADILNALELAEEFNLDIILEGATEAYLVADRLADADVPVVLGPVARRKRGQPIPGRSAPFDSGQYRRHSERNAAALTKAGVRWTLGSGAESPGAARFVAFNAQLAAAHGQAEADWMPTVTTEAAAILNVSKSVGRLARGMRADLVLWSGDPGDPASTVERVYVGGKLAYVAEKEQPQGGGP